ncbi:DUF5703 domain-containing protein [Mucilaginibacter gilvus]|uniref:DUF5703 domain-containing protein n=1 Tax=Mucilaginibacter gilvus TaxID=2305909 RepID=A0A3S3UZ12_9SPHI|nr:DUF5703 domain-containing protein [Mucilaginibacter gilvus]RWY51626.1 hypothetical protein EPL05_12160 [Mucilaginibacter gilvus]
MKIFTAVILLLLVSKIPVCAQTTDLDKYNMVWNTQSQNSSQSMPCGGGDIGLNVWVEHGDILFYIARSGTYDENNALLKLGRVRVHLSPDPFSSTNFKQTLHLKDGYVSIEGGNPDGLTAEIKIWVDVFNPRIYLNITGSRPLSAKVTYEAWRYHDTEKKGLENNENSYKFAAPKPIVSYKDSIAYRNGGILFYHQNRHAPTAFDVTVHQQGLDGVKSQMFDPIKNLIFGGILTGDKMEADVVSDGKYINTNFRGWQLKSIQALKSRNITLTLHTQQTPDIEQWKNKLSSLGKKLDNEHKAMQVSQNWWHRLWQRSYIYINPNNPGKDTVAWQSGRNYQLFRYMLACNAFGNYPTKFNGGLFTYDPAFVNNDYAFTPDFRNWGGSIFTAQNQRLVYYPMLKSGDFDMMLPEFNFYLRLLKNAELATNSYWPHKGARFTEQIDNFGLSDFAEYGINRPKDFDAGVDYNPWLEYHWDSVLEFCYMMLETGEYGGKDIKPYLPFIESCLTFFDEHYRYLALRRGAKELDGDGKLILFPGSSGETFKMAYNSTTTISGLRAVLQKLLSLSPANLDSSKRYEFSAMLNRIPPISYQYINGHQTIAPAKSWERINNEENPQLYPVFPYGVFGIGKPNIDVAMNTWKYDTLAIKFRSYIGWKPDNLFAARLGLTHEAARLTFDKLKNSGRKFPAFWGPGFDWTPDHNWGGSGMTGLQEMLLQTAGNKIYLFPAWPKDLNVHFKLYATGQTIIECSYKDGKIQALTVTPKAREKDIVNCLE